MERYGPKSRGIDANTAPMTCTSMHLAHFILVSNSSTGVQDLRFELKLMQGANDLVGSESGPASLYHSTPRCPVTFTYTCRLASWASPVVCCCAKLQRCASDAENIT